MRPTPVLAAMLFALLCAPAPGRAQGGASINVGDEVVFSGGPGAPPKSIQTGFTMEIGSVRGSGGSDVIAAEGKGKGKEGGAGSGVNGAPDLTAKPAAPPDLSKLGTEDLTIAAFDREPLRRQAAVSALASHTAPAERATVKSALESALTDAEPRVVQQAAESLGKLGDPASATAVMPLVYDRDDAVAVSAIKAVAVLGYRKAVPELTKLADRDPGPVGQAARAAAAELSRPPRSIAIDPATQPAPKVP